MYEQEAEQLDVEHSGAGALASAVAKLCDIARASPADALSRCDLIMQNFEDGTIDRRHRASSISALQLAIGNRMPQCAVKAHIADRLSGRLDDLRREGRFDGRSNRRIAFQ